MFFFLLLKFAVYTVNNENTRIYSVCRKYLCDHDCTYGKYLFLYSRRNLRPDWGRYRSIRAYYLNWPRADAFVHPVPSSLSLDILTVISDVPSSQILRHNNRQQIPITHSHAHFVSKPLFSLTRLWNCLRCKYPLPLCRSIVTRLFQFWNAVT